MMTPQTILIADDEPVVRNLIIAVLVREGYSVLEADSAAEALQLSNKFEGCIDLLIADHTLKTMTGRQVAEKICLARPALNVLHISGYGREKLEQEGGIIPGAAFLVKPFPAKRLIEKVRETLAPKAASGAA